VARSTVSPEVKAAALADLLAGEQPAVVAERYDLNPATVRKWKERLEVPAVVTPEDVTPDVTVSHRVTRPREEARQREIGALILDLLAAKLEASAALARTVSDPEWLRKQRGSELAALGSYLDTTALAIGDRLAGGSSAGSGAGGNGGDAPAD
jgi:transposase-like protein